MYNLSKNNYHQKPKNSNIQTPSEVSEFIYELLRDKFSQDGLVFDPCCGRGNLLKPWERSGYNSFGIDISSICIWVGKDEPRRQTDFLLEDKKSWKKSPSLILCNPPFNGYGQQLGSEVWLDKILELFGKEIPIVLFAPIGFRLNLTTKSNRWKKLSDKNYPPISSIISLPKNVFEGVVFHSEILIFNIPDLAGHYFYTNHEI